MISHEREPIKHTCPNIDKYIKEIKWALVEERYLSRLDEKDLYDAACAMASMLESCISYLDELRDSNHTLRMWGIDEAENVDSLELYVKELESKTPII